MTKRILSVLAMLSIAAMMMLSSCNALTEKDEKEEEVLADKTVEIPALGYQSWDITLSERAEISVDLKVEDGKGVKFYTVDQDGYNAIKAGKDTFTYYPSLSSNTATTSFSFKGTVNEGHTYFVVINDNLLSAQKVHTKITVKELL